MSDKAIVLSKGDTRKELARLRAELVRVKKLVGLSRPTRGLMGSRARGPAVDDADDSDRDAWITPWWIADALGPVAWDPCWNLYSHIEAAHTFDFNGRGEDATKLSHLVPDDPGGVIFINPPYSRGLVMKFALCYRKKRFCFLVRCDASTSWFNEIYAHSELLLIPRIRVNFEPPPGAVVAGENHNNPYPHALMFARASDAPPELRSQCFEMWTSEKGLADRARLQLEG